MPKYWLNVVIIQLGKFFISYRRGSHGTILNVTFHGVYFFFFTSIV